MITGNVKDYLFFLVFVIVTLIVEGEEEDEILGRFGRSP